MTTEAMLTSFAMSDTTDHESRLLSLLEVVGDYGFTYDEAYAFVYPGRASEHSDVDSFRVAVRHLREDGYLKDSGLTRPNNAGNRPQTVWVPGDDRDVVLAKRLEKMHKLCAKLGYRAVKIGDGE